MDETVNQGVCDLSWAAAGGDKGKQGQGSTWDSPSSLLEQGIVWGLLRGVWGVAPPDPDCSRQGDMEGTQSGANLAYLEQK